MEGLWVAGGYSSYTAGLQGQRPWLFVASACGSVYSWLFSELGTTKLSDDKALPYVKWGMRTQSDHLHVLIARPPSGPGQGHLGIGS